MPWTLYRLLLGDLLRIIGLTAVVLVTVIAFGATIKPLASDALLDAVQTAKYMGLAIIPMLQFALPFAAGFGATLALHRMTTDNEIQAMAASGISYRRILLPIAALGIALTLLMVVLTQWVIPVFWSLIMQTAARDVTKVFQAQIQRGEPFQLGDLQIYADGLIVRNWPEGAGGPETRMLLSKVAAAELDSNGRIVTDVTASGAVVDVYRQGGRTFLKLVMTDAMAFNSATGDLAHSDQIAPPRAIMVLGALRDNPKALTRAELLALRRNPDDFEQVRSAKRVLAQAIREAAARDAIDAQLHAGGQVELIGDDPAGAARPRAVTVHADRLHDTFFVARRGREIEIVQSEGGAPTLRFSAWSAELAVAAGEASGAPTFDLILGEHEVVNLQENGTANKRARLVIPNLRVAGQPEGDLAELTSQDLIRRAVEVRTRPERLKQKITELNNEIQSLLFEITSRLLHRYALSATAFLLLMLGAVLAMWRRGSLPLTTYVWAFMPAVLDLIALSAGEELLRDGRSLGHIVMWSGNAAMVGLIVFAYGRLARN